MLCAQDVLGSNCGCPTFHHSFREPLLLLGNLVLRSHDVRGGSAPGWPPPSQWTNLGNPCGHTYTNDFTCSHVAAWGGDCWAPLQVSDSAALRSRCRTMFLTWSPRCAGDPTRRTPWKGRTQRTGRGWPCSQLLIPVLPLTAGVTEGLRGPSSLMHR